MCAAAQIAAPPEVVGTLVGPGANPAQPSLQLYGTDLGWTFEHDGRLQMLFGDTWHDAFALCEGEPRNDDTVATLPLQPPDGVPPLTFVTKPDAPDEFAAITVARGTESLPMAYGQVPIAGFSDGTQAIGLFGRGEPVRCAVRRRRQPPRCQRKTGLTCTQEVGECSPRIVEATMPCDLGTGIGCLPGSTCQPSPSGFCVDLGSSQYDGTPASLRFAVAHDQELAVQDATDFSRFTSVARLATTKFINATTRTVRTFTGGRCGNDYAPGHGALLMWGRPGWQSVGAREAQLYLLAHRLPMKLDRQGRWRFRPRYFAGLDSRGEPRWRRRQRDAVPLALDGVAGGSPHEEQPIVNQMSVSWVGAPVSKWVMLYGGDLADYLLPDPASQRPGAHPGAVRIRFADHPWGPWSPPEAHLLPGSPDVVGAPWGPGGVLFHDQCVDVGDAVCAPGDPRRPPDFFLPGCPSFAAAFDVGRFYGPNVIDVYTRAAGPTAMDLFWNVSTWNPYAVILMRSRIEAGPAATPATCRTRRRG
jgi:hypothetical protein